MIKIDLSIIIVNYNTKNLLRNLLTSFKNSNLGNYKAEVIVIDNASFDGSVEMVKNNFSQVKLVINKKNLGYAKANNKGIRKARGRYILLLNSDTLLNKTTIFKMIKFMDENKKYIAATCRIELADGEIDLSCHRGFPTPWAAFIYFSGLEKFFPESKVFGCYHQGWKDMGEIHDIDVISGAFFMIRKSVFKKIGLLDERFFIYAEDIDLCYRIKQSGQKIAFNPHTKITHFKTSSGRKSGKSNKITRKDKEIRKRTSKYFFETMKLFYDKHYKDKYPWIIRKIVLFGIWIVSKIKK